MSVAALLSLHSNQEVSALSVALKNMSADGYVQTNFYGTHSRVSHVSAFFISNRCRYDCADDTCWRNNIVMYSAMNPQVNASCRSEEDVKMTRWTINLLHAIVSNDAD